jgi:hypothetical protein
MEKVAVTHSHTLVTFVVLSFVHIRERKRTAFLKIQSNRTELEPEKVGSIRSVSNTLIEYGSVVTI